MHNTKTFRIEVELVLPRVFELDVKQCEKFRDHANDLLLGRIPPRTHAHASTKCANTFTALFDHLVFACPPFCVDLIGIRKQVAMVEQRGGHEDLHNEWSKSASFLRHYLQPSSTQRTTLPFLTTYPSSSVSSMTTRAGEAAVPIRKASFHKACMKVLDLNCAASMSNS